MLLGFECFADGKNILTYSGSAQKQDKNTSGSPNLTGEKGKHDLFFYFGRVVNSTASRRLMKMKLFSIQSMYLHTYVTTLRMYVSILAITIIKFYWLSLDVYYI